jgi:hypothetical protein
MVGSTNGTDSETDILDDESKYHSSPYTAVASNKIGFHSIAWHRIIFSACSWLVI